MAESSKNPQQLHVKISRFLPLELKRALHPSALDELCKQAFTNGWTDAEWLAGYALEGTSHPSVENPSAVFVHRMREIVAQQCPVERTAQPPDVQTVLADINRGHQPAQDPSKHIQQIRRTLGETA